MSNASVSTNSMTRVLEDLESLLSSRLPQFSSTGIVEWPCLGFSLCKNIGIAGLISVVMNETSRGRIHYAVMVTSLRSAVVEDWISLDSDVHTSADVILDAIFRLEESTELLSEMMRRIYTNDR